MKPTLTLTLGFRAGRLFSPPWETNKLQVQPTIDLDQWFLNRATAASQGIASNTDPLVSFDWSGAANGRRGYYDWDYKNLGPRFAFAWAPKFGSGLLGDAFGDGKTAIRGGFGMVYDRVGQGIADDFSQYGSFGLSTELTNSAAVESVFSAPRATGIHDIPTTDNNGDQIFLKPPPAVFPITFPTGTFYIGSTIDRGLKTPYAYTIDFSIQRELKGGFTLEASYVGRLSRRLLMQNDVATPTNLKDPASGTTYLRGCQRLAKSVSRWRGQTRHFPTRCCRPMLSGDKAKHHSASECRRRIHARIRRRLRLWTREHDESSFVGVRSVLFAEPE